MYSYTRRRRSEKIPLAPGRKRGYDIGTVGFSVPVPNHVRAGGRGGAVWINGAAPEGADILGWRLEGSELKLEVSPEWAELSGFEKTVAECCAALSFCALEGVERVSFYLLGQRLGRSIDEGDIILSAYAEEE